MQVGFIDHRAQDQDANAKWREREVPASVVTMSRAVGAGGEAVGWQVAQQLGFRYVDHEIVAQAAERANVTIEEAANAEQRQALMSRIMNSFALAAAANEPSDYAPVERPAHMEDLIREAVLETAKAGQAVIVAHAASIPLAGMSGLLRVLVTASPVSRARRIAEAEGSSEREALRAVEESDAERRDYFHRFYDLSEELPTHYDLVVNTDVLRIELASAVVVQAARVL